MTRDAYRTTPSPWRLTVDQPARLVGCSVERIGELHTLGLLALPRLIDGVACYGPNHVRRLRFVAESQSLGASMSTLARTIAYLEGEVPGSSDAQALLAEHLARLNAAIARGQSSDRVRKAMEVRRRLLRVLRDREAQHAFS